MLLAPFMNTEQENGLEELLDDMKETGTNLGVKNICSNDKLIREFGKCLLGSLGNENEQRRKDKDNIRTTLRSVKGEYIYLRERI